MGVSDLVIVIKVLNEHHTYFYEENRHGWGLGREKRGQICTLVVVAKAPKSATQRQGEQGFLADDGAFGDFWGFLGDAMVLFGAWVRGVARWLGD